MNENISKKTALKVGIGIKLYVQDAWVVWISQGFKSQLPSVWTINATFEISNQYFGTVDPSWHPVRQVKFDLFPELILLL